MFLKVDKSKLKVVAVSPEPLKSNEKFEVIEIETQETLPEFFVVRKSGEKITVEELPPEEKQRVKQLKFQQTKERLKRQLNLDARNRILQKLRELDWGETYEECIAELQNSAISTETEILYRLKPFKPDLTLTEIREKVAMFLAGNYTQQDFMNELSSLGIDTQAQPEILDLFRQAREIAELLYWVEQVWKEVETLEKQIDNAKDPSQLPSLEQGGMLWEQFPPQTP
ncbi:MAG: hypothetical protein DSY42_04200 [Aquifex sp.]|nr:MAG: hypothetical protein DSY42_04200 [Aquifex sp.]